MWTGESYEQEQLRQIKRILDKLPLLSPEQQAKFETVMTLELRAMIDALPPAAPARPNPMPLLRHLRCGGAGY